MPIVSYLSPSANTELYIWRISEGLSYFLDKLHLSDQDLSTLATMLPKRQLEWILPRYLCHVLWNQNPYDYRKDGNDKPYLANSTQSISISHSGEMFAIIKSSINCGIDIQLYNPKIAVVQQKFTTDIELRQFSNLKLDLALHNIWCTKEAVYKCYGRRQISLIDHISVRTTAVNGLLLATVVKNTKSYTYQVAVTQLSSYTLAYALEKN